MANVSFLFAGGGTGGHIYPALAIAEQILEREPQAGIQFLHSTRDVDARILGRTTLARMALPATGLYLHPARLLRFATTFRQSYHLAREAIAESPNPVVVGVGGYVAAPVCLAGHKLGVPVALVNVDIVPGRANRLSARWADEIFVQFEESRARFGRRANRVDVVGCPLRRGFAHPEPAGAVKDLSLDPNKKVLLITGASSGSASINEAVCRLLERLEAFADGWQIVHLTGLANYEAVRGKYDRAGIAHRVQGYYDRMPDLLAAADLVVGRSGAVSVAEYAAAGVASICMPYPHHKDRHQYLNAGILVEAGAAVVVDDLPDADERVGWLWEELADLMRHDDKRRDMAQACTAVARPNAAAEIAARLLAMTGNEGAVTANGKRDEPVS